MYLFSFRFGRKSFQFSFAAMGKDYVPPPGLPSTSHKPLLKPQKKLANVPPTLPVRRTYSTVSYDDTGWNEEREIRQFIDTVPVVPKLPRMPDISKYLNKGKTVNQKKTTSDRSAIIKNYM